ncbi:MAG: hypothetical protein KOO63_16475 [Bacteroidales bacterium]|nr:hypothetical protein [Candidatus Latescibacterota bacterium]
MSLQQIEVKPVKVQDRKVSVAIFSGSSSFEDLMKDQLQRCLIDGVSIFDLSKPGDIDLSPFSALFLECSSDGFDAESFVSTSRKNGYRGVIVAVMQEKDSTAAMGLVRAGADRVLILPVDDVEFDLVAENIRSLHSETSSLYDTLKSYFQPVEQGVILLDHFREVVFANHSARVILAVRDENEINDIVDAHCTDSIFEKSRLNGSAITYADIAVKGQESHRLLGLEIWSMNESGSDDIYLVLIHDFSRWKKLDELRSKFATTLSHRMRTPLTSIRTAVRLLGESDETIDPEQKEKLIDIGWRNVEKLIANLDELQKVFMIESEELNVCRTIVRMKTEVKSLFEEFVEEEKIKGFKLSMPDIMVFTGNGRLKDFLVSAIDAYNLWLSENPFIECSTSVKEENDYFGVVHRSLVIYLRPRTSSWFRTSRESLKDFLSFHEAHRGLVLGRLAAALDGELQVSPGNTISLAIPLDPVFNREKDLVHPLHMMIERADIMGSELSLVNLSMIGMDEIPSRISAIFEKCLFHHLDGDMVVSIGEKESSYSLFINSRSPEEIEHLLNGVREDFFRTSRDSGEEVYPSFHWTVRYCRIPGIQESPIDKLLNV